MLLNARTLSSLTKNLVYKNIEAQIWQKNKNNPNIIASLIKIRKNIHTLFPSGSEIIKNNYEREPA